MPPLLAARLEGPWPLVIFGGAVLLQVLDYWWKNRDRSASSKPGGGLSPMLGGEFPRRERTELPESVLDSLTEQERAAIRERQIHGTGNGRPTPPPLYPTLSPPPMPVEVPPDLPRESGPGPTTQDWVPWQESPAAMAEAHGRMAEADARATESLPPLQEAPQALMEARQRLAAADARVQRARAIPTASETPTRPATSGVAAELARSLREPATARGAVIAGILLGPPKALEP